MPLNRSLIPVSNLLINGDSLSDRGTLDKRELLGTIPFRVITELGDNSPRGRFTNGFLWGDYFCTTTSEQFEIEKLRKILKLDHDARSNADLSDEYIANGNNLLNKNEQAFSLDNDKQVLFEGQRFARFYCEGGLTAHDYSTTYTCNLVLLFTRFLMATLDSKRKSILADDKKYQVSDQEKLETLIIEWSGANDLITVNTEPSQVEVDLAIDGRINNIEQLIHRGYRNIVLLNLPDLSFTPKYQAEDLNARNNASSCSTYFNQQLVQKTQALKDKYKNIRPTLTLMVFDVATLFTEVYNAPEKYGFDKSKLTIPYITSDEFKNNQQNPVDQKDHTSPSNGYMFWDTMHPTADMHALLAEQFSLRFSKIFQFMPPSQKKSHCKMAEDMYQKPDCVDPQAPRPNKPLPSDIARILNDIYTHALTLRNSTNTSLRVIGQLLEQLVLDAKCQNGDINDLQELIDRFTLNPDKMEQVQSRGNRFYDFFLQKKPTYYTEKIQELKKAIHNHWVLAETRTF